jgi:hypothetical protein
MSEDDAGVSDRLKSMRFMQKGVERKKLNQMITSEKKKRKSEEWVLYLAKDEEYN